MTNLQETGPSIFLKMFRFRSFICIAVTGMYYPYLLVTQSWRIKITHRLSTGCKTVKIAAYSHFDSWAKISDKNLRKCWRWNKIQWLPQMSPLGSSFPAKWLTPKDFTLPRSDSDPFHKKADIERKSFLCIPFKVVLYGHHFKDLTQAIRTFVKFKQMAMCVLFDLTEGPE